MIDHRSRITDALKAAKEYRGSDLYRHFVDLLQAIEDAYKEDLIDVTEDRLKYKQGAAKQVRLLRSELLRDAAPRDLPKV